MTIIKGPIYSYQYRSLRANHTTCQDLHAHKMSYPPGFYSNIGHNIMKGEKFMLNKKAM